MDCDTLLRICAVSISGLANLFESFLSVNKSSSIDTDLTLHANFKAFVVVAAQLFLFGDRRLPSILCDTDNETKKRRQKAGRIPHDRIFGAQCKRKFATHQTRNQDFMWGGANEAKADPTTEMYFFIV